MPTHKEKKIITDQMGNRITVDFPPEKIISTVPSQTELLYHLGLKNEVVGITKFCVHPEVWFKNKTRIGGTKNLNLETIEKLQPDLIIGNKEENEKNQINFLQKKYPVWMSDINTLKDALEMIKKLGEATDKKQASTLLIKKIRKEFEKLKNETKKNKPIRTLYFIWNNPYMIAGKNSFIDEMLRLCKLKNISSWKRYPVITDNELKKLNPQLILLSSEPFPFKEKHVNELKQQLPNCKIKIVDGEMFSWYGSRLLKAPNYFIKLLRSVES